jgi:hypothetical protein
MKRDSFGRLPVMVGLMVALLAIRAQGQPGSDAVEAQLSLADMPAYRAALSGRSTGKDASAADPPRPVSFADLWAHSDAWQGRRIIVQGRVARIFRQGAIGSFPPLVEAWLSTSAGDVLCIVFPEAETGREGSDLALGQRIAFTGTFLRSIRYAAADQSRLAPLIVGDKYPDRLPAAATSDLDLVPGTGGASGRKLGRTLDSWSPVSWGLGLLLGLAAAAVLLRQHLRGPSRAASSVQRRGRPALTDPPLEFLDSEHTRGPNESETRSS